MMRVEHGRINTEVGDQSLGLQGSCPGDKSKIGNNLAELSDKLDVRDR